MRSFFSWLHANSSTTETLYSYEALSSVVSEPRNAGVGQEDKHDHQMHEGHEEKEGAPSILRLSSTFLGRLKPQNLSPSSGIVRGMTSIVVHRTIPMVRCVLVFIIPSFLSRYANPEHQNPNRNKKIPSTAYLNGLRGLAAYVVFCQHFMTYFYGNTPLWGFGAHPERDIYFFQLPFVRLIHSGRFCVTIFYLLSGYVLGYKPLQFIRLGDVGGLGQNLSSAIFRRGLRLFLPLITPLTFAAVCVYMGCYGTPKHPMRGTVVASADGTLLAELRKTFKSFDKVINPFWQGVYYPKTIPALYTLRVEFRGSIMVFTVLLGLAKARSQMRMAVATLIASYSLHHGRWDAGLFLFGIVLAEVRYIRASSGHSIQHCLTGTSKIRSLRSLFALFWIVVLVISLYLGSFPRHGAKTTPGYRRLTRMTPKKYLDSDDSLASLWCSIAAILLVSALENLPILQIPFNTAFARYMGDISFSLYVFHVPLYLTVGRWITVHLIRLTGSYNLGFVLGGGMLTTVLIAVADIQWRAVDMNSVKFARWLEERVFP